MKNKINEFILVLMKLLDRFLGSFNVGKVDMTVAAKLFRRVVLTHPNLRYFAALGKQFFKLAFGGRKANIRHEDPLPIPVLLDFPVHISESCVF